MLYARSISVDKRAMSRTSARVKRVVIGLALLTSAITAATAGRWIHRVISFEADRVNYYVDGENDARADLRKGRLRTKDAAADTLKDRIYRDILERSYNIERDRLVGDIVPAQVTEYVRGYNAVMDPSIENYLGDQILDQVRQQANQELERQTSVEEYAVYAAILREVERPERVLVIGDETFDGIGNLDPELKRNAQRAGMPDAYELGYVIESNITPALTPLKPSLSQAIEDYKVKNQQPRRIEAIPGLSSRYVLLSNQDFEAFFANLSSGWASYNRNYPRSIGRITLSRVGLNRETTVAVVYVELECGSLCADGRVRILKKRMGTWKSELSIPFFAS